MERLLKLGMKTGEQAEVYSLDERSDEISFENGRLKNVESTLQSGISLRMICHGRLGFAYTKNLAGREELLKNCIASSSRGVESTFTFPCTRITSALDLCDRSLESIPNSVIAGECRRICGLLAEKTTGEINMTASRRASRVRIINSSGADLAFAKSRYSLDVSFIYAGSRASVRRHFRSHRFETIPDDRLEFIRTIYTRSQKEVKPQGGRMAVLFLPESIYPLVWRVRSATSGKSVYEGTSPFMEKTDRRVFDKKISIYNDPSSDVADAKAFDDEGIPCACFPLVEHGVLKNFYYDLHYAHRMNEKPTGHGFKAAMWGEDTVSLIPRPWLGHLFMQPGEKAFSALLSSIDRGMVIPGVLGAHSGNILNGDFSVGLSPGIYVEKGEILGHVKNAMVAGNAFELMQRVIDIEDTAYPSRAGIFPSILFDDVNVILK